MITRIGLTILAGLWTVAITGCNLDDEDLGGQLDFDSFRGQYNDYVANWLSKEKTRLDGAIAETNEKIAASADDTERARHEDTLAEQERDLERINFRTGLGDFFALKSPDDLPDDLNWEDGMDEPEIGDPACKKGGTFRSYINNFPPTLRPFGPDSNNSFRSELYDRLELSLVDLHPTTKRIIPAVANQWAVSEDRRTVYFRIDPDAKYNDGVPVKALDFMIGVYIRVSDNVVAPYPKQYFREQFGQIALYDEMTLSVTLATAKPLTPYFATIRPFAPHFFKDYGPDFADRYRWKVPPTTGAYFVRDEDIIKGVSITLTRAQDWWAKDKKFYRYRFNPDKVRFTVIRDETKAYELFRAGELDYFYRLTQPEFWYEKSQVREFFNGYIEKHVFYHQYPHPPYGLWLNLDRPALKDLNVRLGIAHATNWKKVIDVIYRGDYERLQQVCDGQGEFTNPEIRARPFSITKAKEYFRAAGFTEEGPDGILQKPDGTPLEIALSFRAAAHYPRMMAVLKEEARKAGLNFRLDGQEPTINYLKGMKKEHEAIFWAWSVTPPFPRLYQLFHSKNAYDEKGNVKQQTNNLNSYANPDMDRYVIGIRNATTEEELKGFAYQAQQLAHDEVLFVPGYALPFARIGCWRWMRWPDTEDLRFCPPLIDRPRESYVFWIDEEMKRETLERKRAGETFPEVQATHEAYRRAVSNGERGTP